MCDKCGTIPFLSSTKPMKRKRQRSVHMMVRISCLALKVTLFSSFSFLHLSIICQISQVLKIPAVPKEAASRFGDSLGIFAFD